jgi:hypothetical protein
LNLDARPGPWSFHDAIYGLQNVVLDVAGRRICNHVSRDIGPLIAAAPGLALALWRISRIVPIGSPAHAIATTELERLGYKRPKLRVVGEVG